MYGSTKIVRVSQDWPSVKTLLIAGSKRPLISWCASPEKLSARMSCKQLAGEKHINEWHEQERDRKTLCSVSS